MRAKQIKVRMEPLLVVMEREAFIVLTMVCTTELAETITKMSSMALCRDTSANTGLPMVFTSHHSSHSST